MTERRARCVKRYVKDYSDRRDLVQRRRKMFLPVLERLGLAESFSSLPQWLRHRILTKKFPRPQVSADESLRETCHAGQVVAELERVLDEPCIAVPGVGQKVSPSEYFCYLIPLQGATYVAVRDGSVARRAAGALAPLLEMSHYQFSDHLNEKLDEQVADLLLRHSRIDERVYWCDFLEENGADWKAHEVLRIGCAPARKRIIRAEGQARPAFQCGGWFGGKEVLWAQWERSLLGLEGAGALPVYVQSHALHRLIERLGTADDRSIAHALLLFSVDEPQIVRRGADGFWLSCGPPDLRIGYLLGTVVEDVALIRTFLFLTMDGTPESRRLYDRLGARRADIEALRLNELATFLDTDLADDPQLASIFSQCGCGHLFKLRDHWDRGAHRWEHARHVRAYLRLRDRPTAADQTDATLERTARKVTADLIASGNSDAPAAPHLAPGPTGNSKFATDGH